MRKILILDEDTPARGSLVAQLETANADVVLANDAADAIVKLRGANWAAFLADISLSGEELPGIIAALRGAPWRPVVVLVAEHPEHDLDPNLISLVVRKPYDVRLVSGIFRAAIDETPPGAAVDAGDDKSRRPIR